MNAQDHELLERNAGAFLAAEDIEARLARGELIGGVNAADCVMRCGRVVEWRDVDEGGPEQRQPEGFLCQFCDSWCCNTCGDRKERVCPGCAVYGIAQDLKTTAVALEEAAFKEDRDLVRRRLSRVLTLAGLIGQHEINICARTNPDFRPIPTLSTVADRYLRPSRSNGNAGGERVAATSEELGNKDTTPLGEILRNAPAGS